MSRGRWNDLPFLDTLRPEPSWQVDRAVVATYSLDPVAALAALLALSGLGTDAGAGGSVDLAMAFETLRGRAKFLAQAGRIACPRKRSPVFKLLDRHVQAVQADENDASWHPKMAVIRMVPSSSADGIAGVLWRVWIGSRNLTRWMAFDAGLSLEAVPAVDGEPRVIPGLTESIVGLLRRAGLHEPSLVDELERLQWRTPPGVTVRSLRLHELDTERVFPDAPDGLRKLTVIGPFLGGRLVHQLGTWGGRGVSRHLVSTRPALSKLAAQAGNPLAGFRELSVLHAPDDEETTVTEPAVQNPAALGRLPAVGADSTVDEEVEPLGLHAKIILAEAEHTNVMWMGSANIGSRAWRGPNAEVVAELEVDESIVQGLHRWIESTEVVDLRSLPAYEPEDEDVELLDTCRAQLASRWILHQRGEGDVPVVYADEPPFLGDPRIELELGLVGARLIPWPRAARELRLPPTEGWERTELCQVRLRLGNRETTWLQTAAFQSPLAVERDHQTIARFLTARDFLAWVRILLAEGQFADAGFISEVFDELEPSPATTAQHSRARGEGWAPSLEEILKAWARDPSRLDAVDARVGAYLDWIERGVSSVEQVDPDEMEQLRCFRQTWAVVRAELGGST